MLWLAGWRLPTRTACKIDAHTSLTHAASLTSSLFRLYVLEGRVCASLSGHALRVRVDHPCLQDPDHTDRTSTDSSTGPHLGDKSNARNSIRPHHARSLSDTVHVATVLVERLNVAHTREAPHPFPLQHPSSAEGGRTSSVPKFLPNFRANASADVQPLSGPPHRSAGPEEGV